ncbi:MAG: leucyl aminopeptidase [Desulfobacterales bacterium]|nr:leucyl aminopeptidase [Desulfobacterales bacterium]
MIKFSSINVKNTRVETLVIPVCADKSIHTDRMIAALAKRALTINEFKAGPKESLTLYNPPRVKCERVLFLGLGKAAEITSEVLRTFMGRAVQTCMAGNLLQMTVAVPVAKKIKLSGEIALNALIEGGYLANHMFSKYKSEAKKKPLKAVTFIGAPGTATIKRRQAADTKKVCDAAIMAREWVSTPSNDKRPDAFARQITKAARSKGLTCRVLDERALKREKFGAMLAVGQGSQVKPRLVVLERRPKGSKKTVALVGKGVTFDSGGINLKSSGGLNGMKMDMAGAAAVAGTLLAVASLKPKIGVVGVLPIVENMPSGSATRPGDIIKSYAGKTVEIGNTDAEGRLILADAMAWAVKTYKPDVMIDLATLTGACVVALGEKIAGVFTSDDDIAGAILTSADKTNERCWRLPLPDDYKDYLKSDLADIANMSSSRWGGASTAALFLSEFVGDTRWAHIDIAGPAYSKKDGPYCRAGGTGFGVRLLCDLLTGQDLF